MSDDMAGGQPVDPLVEAGAALRPYLAELLGDEADEFEEELVSLLRTKDRTDLLTHLSNIPAVHTWIGHFLQYGIPPGVSPTFERAPSYPGQMTYTGLAGIGVPLPPPLYVCPIDELYRWYRPDVGVPVPFCPDHPTRRLVLRSRERP